jgi:hypothetical protein
MLALIHNFTLYKNNALQYLTYLEKRPNEISFLPANLQSRHWTILADKEYIGVDLNYPEIH